MPTAREKRNRNSGLISLATTQLTVAGWLAMSLPSAAAPIYSYPYSPLDSKDFRVCAARLVSANISPETAASSCASAIRPRTLSSCVVDISRRTNIAAEDALSNCREVRRPEELGTCVVDISRNSQGEIDPAVLNYCSRSLLPERFSDCVVGLRREIDLAPTQALDSCISATDPLPSRDFAPGFLPQNGTPPVLPTLTPQPGSQGQQIPAPVVPPATSPRRR